MKLEETTYAEIVDGLASAYAALSRHGHAPWEGPEIQEHRRATSLGIGERFTREAIERAKANGETLLHVVIGAAFNLGQSMPTKDQAGCSDDAVARARALLAAATPGPWAQCMEESPDGCYGISPPMPTSEAGRERARRDAALIAAAPELLATLCDELDAETKRADEAEAGAAAMTETAQFFAGLAGEFLNTAEAAGFGFTPHDGADEKILANLERVKDPTAAAAALLARLHAAEAERDGYIAAAERAIKREIAAQHERDEARAERDRLRKDWDNALHAETSRMRSDLAAVTRERDALRARKARVCECASVVMGYSPGYVVVQSFCDYSVAAKVDCPDCHGTGAVIVEPAP